MRASNVHIYVNRPCRKMMSVFRQMRTLNRSRTRCVSRLMTIRYSIFARLAPKLVNRKKPQKIIYRMSIGEMCRAMSSPSPSPSLSLSSLMKILDFASGSSRILDAVTFEPLRRRLSFQNVPPTVHVTARAAPEAIAH